MKRLPRFFCSGGNKIFILCRKFRHIIRVYYTNTESCRLPACLLIGPGPIGLAIVRVSRYNNRRAVIIPSYGQGDTRAQPASALMADYTMPLRGHGIITVLRLLYHRFMRDSSSFCRLARQAERTGCAKNTCTTTIFCKKTKTSLQTDGK